jgi:hypothetical protein
MNVDMVAEHFGPPVRLDQARKAVDVAMERRNRELEFSSISSITTAEQVVLDITLHGAIRCGDRYIPCTCPLAHKKLSTVGKHTRTGNQLTAAGHQQVVCILELGDALPQA